MSIVSKRKKKGIKKNNNYCNSTICTVLMIIIHLVMDFESILQNWVLKD